MKIAKQLTVFLLVFMFAERTGIQAFCWLSSGLASEKIEKTLSTDDPEAEAKDEESKKTEKEAYISCDSSIDVGPRTINLSRLLKLRHSLYFDLFHPRVPTPPPNSFS